MRTSEAINELATALAKAQGSIEDAAKDAKNPAFKSKYADLAAVREAIRLPLSSNGLSYVQGVRSIPEGVEVETMLMHSSGQFIAETLLMPVGQRTAHGFGSAITYAKRYSLMGMVGLAASEDDDDGNAAMAPVNANQDYQRDPKPQSPPAVSTKAINLAREIKQCKTLADIEALQRTDEFKAAWKAMNEVDRDHVGKTGARHRHELTGAIPAPADVPADILAAG